MKPRGKVSRYFDTIFLILISFSSILGYYLIEYQLCILERCSNLEITKYWVDTSIGYVIYGICVFTIGVFVFKEKDLPWVYGLAISIAVGISAVFNVMLIFAISKELANIT